MGKEMGTGTEGGSGRQGKGETEESIRELKSETSRKGETGKVHE